MNRQVVFLLCSLALLAVSVNADVEKKKKAHRIVNGQPIKIDEAPYQVQLRTNRDFFFCGGSLVAPQFVISAAHCFKDIHHNQMVVVAGATYKRDSGEKRTIIDKIIHPHYNFNEPMSDHDIVVLKLDRPLQLNKKIYTIPLCNKLWNAGTTATVTGWGAPSSGAQTTDQLQSVQVPLVGLEHCKGLYKNFAPVTGSMFCAANLKEKKDACQGDSGGPLVINGQLCGVVSWGRGCARNDSPGVYTSITYEMEYIVDAIRAMS